MKTQLIRKLKDKTARIAVLGLGYVGLPLVRHYIEAGYPVLGFDIDERKVASLRQGRSYIEHIAIEPIKAALDSGQFTPTTDFSLAAKADAIILCVPTPLTRQREPDLSFVINSAREILPHLKPGQALSLESTTYPGTTEEELRTRLERAGLRIGEDFFLIYSPEREDPNNPHYTARTIPKVVGGSTPACLEVGLALYSGVVERLVPVSSTQAAEMAKILENTFRAVNIALVNELKIVAERMGVDIFEVINAAATKPFGFMPFYPGPGLGGHCIPIDPFYLTWKAREYGVATRFIELAGEVNTAMPEYVLSRVTEALNSEAKSVKGSRILVLGVAYKKNVDDTRESPSLLLMKRLMDLGASVDYSDPHVPTMPRLRKYDFDMPSTAVTPESLAGYDLVLVATNHDRFDWKLIGEHARLIVDTRGVYPQDKEKVWRA